MLNPDRPHLQSCLAVLRRRVVWVSSAAGGPALALRYPQIVMHAVSRDPSSYSRPCIYLQVRPWWAG